VSAPIHFLAMQFEFVSKGAASAAGGRRALLSSRRLLSDHDGTLTVDMGEGATISSITDARVSPCSSLEWHDGRHDHTCKRRQELHELLLKHAFIGHRVMWGPAMVCAD